MRLAYADPPYPGKAGLYAAHPAYAGEVDHGELIERLQTYDGWALSTGSWALQDVLAMCPAGVRVLIWTKHSIARSWEPVIVVPARDEAHVRRLRDWIQVEPEYFQWRPKPESYVIGQKPEPFCRWLFEWLGARPDDTLDDLFPGSGAVTEAWERWCGSRRCWRLLDLLETSGGPGSRTRCSVGSKPTNRPPDGPKRGGKTALMSAEEERGLRELGMPIRCCDYWPECSHVLAWYEKRREATDAL